MKLVSSTVALEPTALGLQCYCPRATVVTNRFTYHYWFESYIVATKPAKLFMAKVKSILETISKEKKQHGKTITMGNKVLQ